MVVTCVRVYIELFPRLVLLVPSLSLGVNKGRMMKKIRCRRSKCVFMDSFILQHGILGLLLVLHDSCRGCAY